MLIGRFGDTTRRPYIEGLLSIPRLGVQAVPISFLIDTGAHRCVLGAVDAYATLQIPRSALQGDVPVRGIGGSESCFEEEAYLAFEDDETVFYYNVQLLISQRQPEAASEQIPSILGREVLHRWEMHYSPHLPDPSLTFDVISDDMSLPGG